MRNINFKLFLLGCLVASSRMDHKEDPMGKVKTYIALQNKDYDYYYIKFTFSGCGVYDSEEALYHEQFYYKKTRECEQISGQTIR